jgi:hypothetical protein
MVGGNITFVPVGMFWQPESLSRLLDHQNNTSVFLLSDNFFERHRHGPGTYKLWLGILLYLPSEMLNLLPLDYPNTLTPVPLSNLDPSVYQLSLITEGRYLCALIHPCLFVIITLYLGSELNVGLLIRWYFKEILQFLDCRVAVIVGC